MSEQEDEGRSGQQLADPSTAKSPQDGSVTVKKPVKVDKKKKKRYPRPSPAKWLAIMEQVSREFRESGEMSQSEVLKKNTEDIRALEQKYEELRSTVEALQSELRGRSNCVDQV